MQSIEQALSQMGVNVNLQGQSSADNSQSGSNSGNGASAVQNTQASLHKLMHDLYQAIQQQQSSGDSNASTSATGQYGDFSSKLKDLIASLSNTNDPHPNGNSTSSTNPAVNQLQADFSSLLANAQSNSTRSNNSNQNLLTFLQNLENNLGNNGSLAATGGLISTTS